jgi:cytochrome P450
MQRLQLLFHPLAALERWAHQYGDPFCLGRNSAQPEVYFSHPEAIQRIATADPQLFEPPRGDRTLRFLLGDHALRYLAGERHQRERRLLSPALHGERMLAHGRQMQAIARDVSDRWRPGCAVRVRAAMQEVTLRVISHAVFGQEDHADLQALRRTLGALLDRVTRPWASLFLSVSPQRLGGPLGPWGYLARRRRVMDGFILAEIRKRRKRADGVPRDILDLLVTARDAEGHGLDDAAVRDEVMMLLFAGHETTASALTWVLHCVHRWPETLVRLRDELATLDTDAEPVAIARLPYLDAVCHETLRLYPGAVGVPKVLRAPLDVMGWRFAPGTQLVPCFYLTHRRADLYPDPTRFLPERFLGRQYSPYEFLPFGAGPRRCIGMAFAQFEMKLVLATILSRWSLSLPGQDLTPVRRGVFAGPPPRMRLVPVARRQSHTDGPRP